MVRRVVEVLEDDLEGGEAVETVRFSLDGTSYEIDLSEANAASLRELLAPFVEAARVSASPRRRPRTGNGESPSEVRAWAEANGIKVNARGRIPADVLAAYRAAH